MYATCRTDENRLEYDRSTACIDSLWASCRRNHVAVDVETVRQGGCRVHWGACKNAIRELLYANKENQIDYEEKEEEKE